MMILMMILMTKPYDYADDTDDDNDHKNDSYTVAGAGPLVLAPWSGLLGPGSLGAPFPIWISRFWMPVQLPDAELDANLAAGCLARCRPRCQ